MQENELSLKELKKLNRTDDLEAVQRAVSAHIPQLTASALAAAIGGTVVLKLQTTEQGKMKYVAVQDTEELIQAIDWFATYGNKFDQEGFVILQQRPPDSKFWDYLTTRHLGKVPDEAKKEQAGVLNLSVIGKKALLNSQKPVELQSIKSDLPIPSSWQK